MLPSHFCLPLRQKDHSFLPAFPSFSAQTNQALFLSVFLYASVHLLNCFLIFLCTSIFCLPFCFRFYFIFCLSFHFVIRRYRPLFSPCLARVNKDILSIHSQTDPFSFLIIVMHYFSEFYLY